MRFTFAEKKLQVSEDVRAYAEKKLGKLDRLFKNEGDASVTFSMERGRFICEATIRAGGMIYRVSETTGDMYASIDSAAASIERQIRKNKTRLEKRLREGAFEREIKAPVIAPEDEETDEFEVVRTKRFSIKPMTVEEAILQMNLLDHEFFVFKNQDEEDKFAVVYKRKNGGYGLIESD